MRAGPSPRSVREDQIAAVRAIESPSPTPPVTAPRRRGRGIVGDPVSIERIEALIRELRQRFTVAVVTHDMARAERASQRVAYFHLGEIVEVGPAEKIMGEPEDERTRAHIKGDIG